MGVSDLLRQLDEAAFERAYEARQRGYDLPNNPEAVALDDERRAIEQAHGLPVRERRLRDDPAYAGPKRRSSDR